MSLTIFDTSEDKVLKSYYYVGKISFADAYKYLVPLINKYDSQRLPLNSKLYDKLKEDLINGCIMPSLTIAFKKKGILLKMTEAPQYIMSMIQDAFILDGIQRLNTIKRIFDEGKAGGIDRPIYLNILIADSMDKLLYRMVTLNNGQKPMSARHQLEILADHLYDFSALSIKIQSEKEQKIKGKEERSFTKANMIKAFMSFITQSYAIDNQKIIDDKLDELITNQIIQTNIPTRNFEFENVINFVDSKVKDDDYLYDWFSLANNLIGFCAAVPTTFEEIRVCDTKTLIEFCKKIDNTIDSIKRSKINLGTFRRKLVYHFFCNFKKFCNLSENEFLLETGDL